VLDGLRVLAPVVAIRGNNDKGAWAERLRATEVVEAAGALLYLLHDVGDLDLDPAAADSGGGVGSLSSTERGPARRRALPESREHRPAAFRSAHRVRLLRIDGTELEASIVQSVSNSRRQEPAMRFEVRGVVFVLTRAATYSACS